MKGKFYFPFDSSGSVKGAKGSYHLDKYDIFMVRFGDY